MSDATKHVYRSLRGMYVPFAWDELNPIVDEPVWGTCQLRRLARTADGTWMREEYDLPRACPPSNPVLVRTKDEPIRWDLWDAVWREVDLDGAVDYLREVNLPLPKELVNDLERASGVKTSHEEVSKQTGVQPNPCVDPRTGNDRSTVGGLLLHLESFERYMPETIERLNRLADRVLSNDPSARADFDRQRNAFTKDANQVQASRRAIPGYDRLDTLCAAETGEALNCKWFRMKAARFAQERSLTLEEAGDMRVIELVDSLSRPIGFNFAVGPRTKEGLAKSLLLTSDGSHEQADDKADEIVAARNSYVEFKDFGQLVRNLESSQRAYQANMNEAERAEKKRGPTAACASQLQAAVIRFSPNPARMPLVDLVQAIVDQRCGTGSTAENILISRGTLDRLRYGTGKVNDLPMTEAGEYLRKCEAILVRISDMLRGTAAITAQGTSAPKKLDKPNGRPIDTDKVHDKQIYERWQTKRHLSYADLDRAMGLKKGEAKLAIDRHRKRCHKAPRKKSSQ